MTDPLKLVQTYELLKVVLEEHEDAGVEASEPAHTLAHGKCAMAAELAADAVFAILNTGTHHLNDPEYDAALRTVLA